MKNALIFFLLFAANLLAKNNIASFSYFNYRGNDAFFEQKINPKTQYRNPIIPGFYPDPSICRRGDDYFLIHSTFSYFPGIPVFHSKDLVHWKQIGNALDRPSQLKLDELALSSGVFAPAIEYCEENQTFYIINTIVGGIGNFIVKSKNPFKGWSEPISLPDVRGIDPSLFFDNNRKAYIVCSQANPKPRWSGHTVLWIYEFDIDNDRVIDEGKLLLDGGPESIHQPRWLEGPHIYKEKGFYFMIAAEGGTQSGHKEVVFRSNTVKGPYTEGANNPILTQLGLPAERINKVTNVGHADLIKTPRGEWFAVFLGCRPYADEQFNTGRETFMLPVKWFDGFPIILGNGLAVPRVVSKDDINPKGDTQSGNFTWRDEFKTPTLDIKWLMLRTPREQWWKIANGKLHLKAIPRNLSQLVNPAFIALRQQHRNFEASTALNFTPTTENHIAGIAYFQNDKNYFVLGKTLKGNKQIIVLQSVVNGNATSLTERELSEFNKNKKIIFYIEVSDGLAKFYYSPAINIQRQLLAKNVDVSNLSTKKAHGFVGSTVGMYVTSLK